MARPKTRNNEDKAFHFRMPKSTWWLLKKAAVIKEVTMGEVVVELIEKQRLKLNKKFDELNGFGQE